MKQLYFILFSLLIGFYSYSQENKTTKDKTRWTPEDVIHTEKIRSVVISENEKMVVFTKNKAVKEKDKFVSDLYLTLLDVKDKNGFKTIQLTNAEENDFSPLFSKNNEFIYFLSSRDKGKKLWKLSVYGGEAHEVNEFKNGISNISWQNESTLFYLSTEGETLRDIKLKEAKDDVEIIEDSVYLKPKRVFAFNLNEKTSSRVTNNKKPINSFTVSDNGKWLVYGVEQSTSFDADAKIDPKYYLQNLETNKVVQILSQFQFPSYNFQFSKDNLGFYFTSNFASDPQFNGAGIAELYYYNLETHLVSKINLQWDLGIGDGYQVVGNDVLVNLANKALYKLVYYKKSEENWKKIDIDLKEKNNRTEILGISNAGNKVVYQYSTSNKLPKFYIASIKKNGFINETELLTLNKNLNEKVNAKSEIFTWQGYNNESVNGILYYPENYESGKKYPLILSIHGGPSGVDTDTWADRWSTYPNLLSQRGAFVLQPNYHGSSNHGLNFVESIKGNYYEPELEDITKAIEILIDKGMVDKEMLGTMGWSNGAILTTMLTVRFPNMFKFAAAGAGDVNWTSDYGTCSFGVSFDQSYFGGAPWDDINGKFYNENYIIKSPLFEIEKIKTPTLIFHGSEDRAVPRDQGWEYYRGLQQVGKAPVKFLWFPGQPHGLGKISHQLRKMNEELDWIDFYLFKKEPTKNDSFKEDSNIAKLLDLEKVKVDDMGYYGIRKNNYLIPEVVLTKSDSISIGRFEVTNAQFKSFNKDYSYKAGLDNYPAVVSKTDAENYVKWLSEITNETYRLPNLLEGKDLHKKAFKAAEKENTLNYWAGYTITLDEVPDFNKKVSQANQTLLKKVGKFKHSKIANAEIYDLGGNVAEYFEGGIYGFSAYDYFDSANDRMIESQYVGIRVIKE